MIRSYVYSFHVLVVVISVVIGSTTVVLADFQNVTQARYLENLNRIFSLNNIRNGYPFLHGAGLWTMMGHGHGQSAVNLPLYSECGINDNMPGMCLKPAECATVSGVPVGFCSTKSVCCSVSLQCGGSSAAKKVVMQGSFSLPTTAPCSYIIQRYSPHVCQLRVDFDTYLPIPSDLSSSAIPGSMPDCGNSYLSIRGMSFCGVNSKQHIYLPFSKSTYAETISVQVAGRNSANWRVMVTQLECPSPAETEGNGHFMKTAPGQLLDINKLIQKKAYDQDLLAPNGCLQYYPETKGVFESFNYNGGAGPYLPNMKYAICFNRPPMASSIQFSAERFNMSFNENQLVDVPMTDGECIDEQGQTQVYANDHLLIPYSTIVQTGEQATRYCGSILEGRNLIATPPGPFEVIVNTGNLYYPPNFGPKPQRAFRLTYSIE